MYRPGGLLRLALTLTAAACTSTPVPSPNGTSALIAATNAPTTTTARPTATTLAIASATVRPAATPTTRPTITPLPSATVIEGFGRLTPIFQDDFRDIISGWPTGGTEAGSVAYNDGALQFEALRDDGWSVWTGRSTLRPRPVLRVEGSFLPPPEGAFGPMCIDAEDRFLAGLLTTDGGWLLIRDDGEGTLEVASDLDAGLQFSDREPLQLSIDCAGAATGQARVRFSLHGTVLSDHVVDDGPETFTYAGVYSEAYSLPHRMRVEHVNALGGTGE